MAACPVAGSNKEVILFIQLQVFIDSFDGHFLVFEMTLRYRNSDTCNTEWQAI